MQRIKTQTKNAVENEKHWDVRHKGIHINESTKGQSSRVCQSQEAAVDGAEDPYRSPFPLQAGTDRLSPPALSPGGSL